MKPLLRACVLFAGLTCFALSRPVAAQVATGPAPDFGAGKKRAAVCFACHGPEGIAKVPGTPHLAGQERAYLEKALRAYREGQSRQDPTMTAMAKPLSDADIANIAAYYSLQTRMSDGQTAAQVMETLQRIRPVGVVQIETPPRPAAQRSGESVYNASCTACHGTGAAGAPKLGDRAAWSSRIAQGKSVLLKHALQGYKSMPPKGTCVACSEEEIGAAIDYLVAKSR